MPVEILGRSSLETYGAIFIAISTAIFPMTWWLMTILIVVALGLIADLCFRAPWVSKFSTLTKTILFIFVGSIISLVGLIRICSEYEKEKSHNNQVGHLIVSKVDGPFISNDGIISISVTIKNNGDIAAFDMRRYSGTAFNFTPIRGEKLDRIFLVSKTLQESSTKNSLDPGEGMVFPIYSLRDWRDEYQKAIEGKAYILFFAIESYKDKNTPDVYIYEKHVCFQLEVDNRLSRCPDHNTNILVKE